MPRISGLDYDRYRVEIKSTKRGRRTKVTDLRTGESILFLGASTKGEGILAFQKEIKKRK
jgi:hypothetical protein